MAIMVAGSCSWAFSTITAVEGINKIVTDDLIALSEQELVDCDTTYNEGCNAMEVSWTMPLNSSSRMEALTVKKIIHTWLLMKNAHVATIDGYEDVPINSESALQKAVANQPITAVSWTWNRENGKRTTGSLETDGERMVERKLAGTATGKCGGILPCKNPPIPRLQSLLLSYATALLSMPSSNNLLLYIRVGKVLGMMTS
ncbi:unnamed protein product [Rhodiola kirilowii]